VGEALPLTSSCACLDLVDAGEKHLWPAAVQGGRLAFMHAARGAGGRWCTNSNCHQAAKDLHKRPP
jgi:hypothetical protein